MGEVFAGRYELIDTLGEGGMGTVWRVWDSREERIVAAKVLRQSDAVSLLRFVREQAFRVVHPHVLTPISWAGEDDRVLFTMPVVEGGSVASLIGDHGPLPAPLVAEVLRQLTSALGAIHEAGILHRDVKPANVLLAATGTGRPHSFLTDFGIAIELDGPRLTQTGQWTGTPSYAAPESQTGGEPHPTADLYAVGQVGIAMLTGARPSAAPVRPNGVPDELWDLLLDLTRVDPGRRPQSAAEVLRRLNAPELQWSPAAMGEVEVLRHVPEPAAGTTQLTADADDVTRVRHDLADRREPATAAPGAAAPAAVAAAPIERGDREATPELAVDAPSTVAPDRVEPPAAREAGLEGGRPAYRSTIVAATVGGVAVLALLAGLVLWAPWSGDGEPDPRRSPQTGLTTSPPTTAATPSTTPSTTPTSALPTPTRGSVSVGTVVVAPGQACQFSDVGVRERTVDGIDVVCQRHDDGSYAWDEAPAQP